MAKVLICDDAAFMRDVIRKMLESAGHQVVGEAEDVDEAVAKFKTLRPDVVTMDLIMKHSGVDAIKNIVAIDPAAKIVLISVLDDQESSAIEAIKAGALGIVTKPIKQDVLLSEVERVLNI